MVMSQQKLALALGILCMIRTTSTLKPLVDSVQNTWEDEDAIALLQGSIVLTGKTPVIDKEAAGSHKSSAVLTDLHLASKKETTIANKEAAGSHKSSAVLTDLHLASKKETTIANKEAAGSHKSSAVLADLSLGSKKQTAIANRKAAGSHQSHALLTDTGLGSKKAVSKRTREYDFETSAIVAALGVAMMTFGAVSIRRSKREIEQIIEMEAEETNCEKLLEKLKAGEDLPSVVIIKGVLSAAGEDVKAASPNITGLSNMVGTIEQPKNALIEIARAVKRGDDNGKFTSIVEKQTGLKPDDIPDVEDDFTSKRINFKDAGCVITEVLISRLCVCAWKEEKTKEDRNGRKYKEITIHRSRRNSSYNVFHARNAADGLYLTDLRGKQLSMRLPEANMVNLVGLGEPPSLFLSTADTFTEFFNYLRKDGLTVSGQHVDLSSMPPTKLGDPLTMISQFIFMDFQSQTDLGIRGNEQALDQLRSAYNRPESEQFLWEPQGFYDMNKGAFPRGATLRTRELVSAEELLRRARRAAEENSQTTEFCEPTFSRRQLPQLRDSENCFRFSELAIPRDSPVTILARPEPDGEGGIRLVPPNSAENGKDVADPDAERFRFRILSGYSIENLLKQRNLNIMQYYGLAVVGAFATLWAAVGCPGMEE